jgi:UDP-N-acetylglucosamine 2-epimerase (non-hydrolysing)
MLHFIIGTRAQLIKTAPVMAACREKKIAYRFIFLAQHKETINEIIGVFGIKRPDLIIGDTGRDITSSKALLRWTARTMAHGIRRRDRMFAGDRNGVAVVHGDALPAIMGAILGKAAGLKVAHVEAGLRSFDFLNPFPEELIRVLIWKLGLADYLFCPGGWALRNVAAYPGKKIDTVYNTLLDSLRMALDFPLDEELLIPAEEYGIVTLHRFETLSSREQLEEVVRIANGVTRRIRLLFILHPPTLEVLRRTGLLAALESNPRLELRPRYDYFRFIRLLQRSRFVITDGGSNQEECFYLGHPCLLLRHATERPEGLGRNAVLSRFAPDVIRHFLDNYGSYSSSMPALHEQPCEIILNALKPHWNGHDT